MSSISQFYLDAMGVDVWYPRASMPGAKLDSIQVAYCLFQNNACVGYLFVAQEAANRSQWTEIERLLGAIVAALKLEMQSVGEPIDFAAAQQAKFILIMGLNTAQALLAQACISLSELRGKILQDSNYPLPILVTEHPLKLIQDPSAKRQVWQELQMIHSL